MDADVDVEFADYVRARQRQLLQLAYLLCGDARLAEVVLQEVLVGLALRWDRVRSGDPDDFVRRRLYRQAVGSRRRKERGELDGLDPDLFAEHPAVAVGRTQGAVEPPDMLRALQRLTPRQRSVVVARFGEERTQHETAQVLGMTAHAVASQTAAALERLASLTSDAASLGSRGSGVSHGALERQVGQQLRHAGSWLPEVDACEGAWAGAVETVRRRRRSVLGWTATATVAALLGGGLVFGGGSSTEDVVPGPTMPTVDPPYQRTFSDVRYAIAPEVGAEQSLRRMDFPLARVLPRAVAAPSTWDWPDNQPVVAVSLLPVSGGDRYTVVVHGPKGTPMQVPDLLLASTLGADGTPGLPLGPLSVSPDGQTVALVQPGRVLLFRVPTGELRTVELPHEGLRRVGWSADGAAVVAGSDQESWTIDRHTLRARRLARVAPAGRYTIGGSGVPRPFLQTWSADGTYVDGMPLPLPPGFEGVGETVDNGLGWAGRAAVLSPDIPSSADGGRPGQGLVAVQSGLPSSVRLLLFGRDNLRPTGCCQAVGWRGHILLFTSASKDGTVHLLGWDVGSAEVLSVAEIPSSGIALGPGARSVPRAGQGR